MVIAKAYISWNEVGFSCSQVEMGHGSNWRAPVSQIRYSLVVILELNSGLEVQYKDMMMVDDEKYQ